MSKLPESAIAKDETSPTAPAAASEDLLVRLGELVNAGILICDADGYPAAWNSWAEKLFTDLDAPLSREVSFLEAENQLAGSQSIYTELCYCIPEHQFLNLNDMDPDKTRIWVMQTRGTIIIAERERLDGMTERVFVNSADTSNREAILQEAMIAAEAASRSKTKFLTNMSHELRTPLNAVIGFSDLMLAESEGPLGAPAYIEFTENINQSGHHLLELINQILDLSRIEAGRFELRREVLDITRLVDHCVRIVSVNADEVGVGLVSQYADCGMLTVDSQAIKQVVLNLLSNAVKFTPGGGHVTVSLAATDTDVMLRVADTGIGIPKQDIANLTVPFEQASNAAEGRQQGYGLGLAISKERIDLHGGNISIESKLNEGTTVTVKLPKIHVEK